MKKLFAALMLIAMLFSLVACAGMNAKPTEPEAYVPSEDIQVLLSFLDGKAKVVTQKTSDKELTGITLACVYFDKNGQQIGAYEEISGEVRTKEKTSNWSFDAPEGCAYLQAAIAAVTYADETAQRCPGVATWAAETAAAFSVETYEANLKSQATEAESCPAVSVTAGDLAEGVLKVKLANTGEKDIANVVVYALWYDADGNPVNAGGAIVVNASRNSLEDLAVEETANYTLEAEEGAAKAKLMVQTVNFKDGTTWENANTHHWLVANYSTAD